VLLVVAVAARSHAAPGAGALIEHQQNPVSYARWQMWQGCADANGRASVGHRAGSVSIHLPSATRFRLKVRLRGMERSRRRRTTTTYKWGSRWASARWWCFCRWCVHAGARASGGALQSATVPSADEVSSLGLGKPEQSRFWSMPRSIPACASRRLAILLVLCAGLDCVSCSDDSRCKHRCGSRAGRSDSIALGVGEWELPACVLLLVGVLEVSRPGMAWLTFDCCLASSRGGGDRCRGHPRTAAGDCVGPG
jgi:hypothetical protein